MIGMVLTVAFLVLFAGFVGWRKYRKHLKPEKQWEGRNPNERVQSTEELEQDSNKYRGFSQIGGGGGGM